MVIFIKRYRLTFCVVLFGKNISVLRFLEDIRSCISVMQSAVGHSHSRHSNCKTIM